MPTEAGVNLHRRGSGPPLLLLHGIGHRWQAWEPVIDRLAAAHHVVALDLPGFGDSPLPDDGMRLDMAGTVARFRELLTRLELSRPHVAGNSLGGAIALELAAADLVASATVFSPAGFYTRSEQRRAVAMLRSMRASTFLPAPVLRAALRLPAVRAMSFGSLVTCPERLDRERMFGDALAMRHGRAFGPVAREARTYRVGPGALAGAREVPVTVAWGQRDRILPPRQAERAAAVLPGAWHVRLPGCGHVPMSDAPQLVAGTILGTTGVARH